MYWVITIVLMFHGTAANMEREYLLKTFNDDWACHEYIQQNKIKLLQQHVMDYPNQIKSFEFYCNSRYGEEI